eukprot:CAMPEP_0181168672 /NCGR_PEP_ID=MMETSP1096-20121128/400_1 /TAXON_ID=156174 ORGANISM="Chrysochromulina ericina, Strain CCMP281" /NCGR_SAMPLE_ID=MMETSP1096 /ASSEMBLY_ACC=CAM_ASM_000453 /LENGTH=103 /DNA_ID=CAMNT_0023256067 /DNA_START=402 /DNA_END=712 /DNA_ORIENTATION=+
MARRSRQPLQACTHLSDVNVTTPQRGVEDVTPQALEGVASDRIRARAQATVVQGPLVEGAWMRTGHLCRQGEDRTRGEAQPEREERAGPKRTRHMVAMGSSSG